MNNLIAPQYTYHHLRITSKKNTNTRQTRQDHNLEDKYPEIFSVNTSKSNSKAKFSPVRKKRHKTPVSMLKKIRISTKSVERPKPRDVPFKVLTSKESQEVKKIMNQRIEQEIYKASNRLNRRIKEMNMNGIVNDSGNFIRRQSLLSLETSTIEQKIPKLKRVATSEVLMKRGKDKGNQIRNSRSELLKKFKLVLVKNFANNKIFTSLKTSDEILEYINQTSEDVKKYNVPSLL